MKYSTTIKKIPKVSIVSNKNKVISPKVYKNRVNKYIKKNNYTGRIKKTITNSKGEKKVIIGKSVRSLQKKLGVNSFPGLIKNSTKYVDGTPGLFTKSIKGMKGKHFIEKGVKAALDALLS